MGDDQVLRDLEAVLAAEREGEIAGAPAVALPAVGGVQLPQTHPSNPAQRPRRRRA